MTQERTRTRREFVRDAGIAAAGTTAIGIPGAATSYARRTRRRQTVAVFGGGIAGLTAAHELAERGFDVTVYERSAWGGRVRGRDLPGTESGGRQPLPTEHSFHGFFGLYKNLADTMRRIPFGSNPRGAFDNLVPLPLAAFARPGKPDLTIPLGIKGGSSYTPQQVRDVIVAALSAHLPPDAAAFFGDRMVVYLSSCDARRSGELDAIAWTDFIAADKFTQDYREILGGIPDILFASRADQTSAKFIAWVVMILLVYNILGFGNDGEAVRVLNGPSHEVLFEPWLAELRQLGVRLHLGHELMSLEVREGQIEQAAVRFRGGLVPIHSDWYVSALPVQRVRKLWDRSLFGR